jgi:hypothetical protein
MTKRKKIQGLGLRKARMWEMRDVCLQRVRELAIQRRKWEDNIKMHEIMWSVEWIP